MDDQTFIVRFEGAEAEHHELDLRRLADSLIGIEQLTNYCLFFFTKGHAPKRNERLPLVVRASAPRRGSFEIEVIMAVASALFRLFRWNLPDKLVLFWKYIHALQLERSGMESYFRDQIGFFREIEDHRHAEFMELLKSQKVSNAAQRVVSPIGSSCERIVILVGGEKIEFNSALAEAIRSGNQTYLGPMEEFRVRVIGLNTQNKRLRVSIGGKPGIVSAEVRDSSFDKVPNIYTAAFTNQKLLNIKAKARRMREGRIKELYIYSATPVADGEE